MGDICTLYIALLLTILIRYGYGLNYYLVSIHIAPFSVIFAFWILVFYIANLYELSLAKNNLEFYSLFFYSFIFNMLAAITFFYFVPLFRITPKTNFFIFFAVSSVVLGVWRYYFNTTLNKRGLRNNTLIIGINQQPEEEHEQSQELFDFIKLHTQLGYNASGIINIDDTSMLSTLENTIKEQKIKTVILTPSVYRIPRIINILYKLLHLNIRVYNLSGFFEHITGKVPLGAIDQIWFLENLSDNQKNAFEFVKRVMDIIGTFIIGIITLPLYPFIMLLIKLDSPGSIMYRQTRFGKSGKPFEVVKFRTMSQNAESAGPIWAVEDDRRTTYFGKFLRRTRIDELPQLWNVLKGEMSFIGPRPERPEFHDKLKAEIPFYEERYLVKPGLTGWAQVKYKLDFKGAMTTQDTAEKVKYDLYYIKNRSILLDVSILLKTVNIILKKIVR